MEVKLFVHLIGTAILACLLQDGGAITNSRSPVVHQHLNSAYNNNAIDGGSVAIDEVSPSLEEECSLRVETALSQLPTRRSGTTLDLTGYAVHQTLRSVPADMYITDMKVKVPGSWGKVDRCAYDVEVNTLQTKVMFRDLTVSGNVKLYHDSSQLHLAPTDNCRMTVRMRKAGLGFTVFPSAISRSARQLTVATTFVEPQFVSVHAYACYRSSEWRRRSDGPEPRTLGEEKQLEMSEEMEQVFLKGVRSLLVRYMEHHLEPVLRDVLMSQLGYTVSYGR